MTESINHSRAVLIHKFLNDNIACLGKVSIWFIANRNVNFGLMQMHLAVIYL